MKAETSGAVKMESIPPELRTRPAWVVYRLEVRDGMQTKVPFNARTGRKASSTDLTSWSTFEAAHAAAERGGYDGVGYVLSSGDPFAGVDLDGCLNPETGEVAGWAQKIVDRLGGYTEVSPSGTGLHVIVRGKAPNKRRGPIEAYSSERYLTVTGDAIGDPPGTIPDGQNALDALAARYLMPRDEPRTNGSTNGHAPHLTDDEIMDLCRKAKNAAKFEGLFDRGDTSPYGGDDSRADQALASLLAFYTDDPGQIDRLFRRSALNREKWERRQDYRARTIRRALDGSTEKYRVPKDGDPGVTATRTFKGRYTVTPIRFAHREAPKPREYVITDLVPKGHTTTVFGDGGSAKSILAMSAGVALAGGAEAWLGRKAASAPVLYVDFELDADEQHRRAYQVARGVRREKPPEDLLYVSGVGRPAGEVLAGCLRVCEEEDVGLVIVDSLGIALQGDAGSAADVIEFHGKFLDPFRAAGVTLLVVDHQGKTQVGERYQSKRAYGSVYKENLSRSVLQVEPAERADGLLVAKIRQTKHNFGPKAEPFGVRLRFTEGEITVLGEDLDASDLAEEQTLNATDRALLILEDGPKCSHEIAEATGMPLGTVKNAISRLRRRGRVEDTGIIDPQTRSRQVRRCNGVTHPYRYDYGVTPESEASTKCVHGRVKAACDVCGEGA